ncbi:MAG: Fe-S cluster protein [Spirochaetaceae bacterium 4572_7]|nr:MAG: Fe-S cluster protein [Spirochaetaceae bacterium 4572_7]
MKHIFKKFKIIIIATVLYLLAFILKKDIFNSAIGITGGFLLEMVQILPPVMILSALITVWVPSETIRKSLGHKAGFKGRILSFFIGSLSAGPIYAAFPTTLVLFKKGASVSNMVIILSTWAVIKVPMLFVETNFLGLSFTITRVALTVPAILIMGIIVGKLIKSDEIIEHLKKPQSHKDILFTLPNTNCGACGFSDCNMFAKAVFYGDKKIMDCIVLNDKQLKGANV